MRRRATLPYDTGVNLEQPRPRSMGTSQALGWCAVGANFLISRGCTYESARQDNIGVGFIFVLAAYGVWLFATFASLACTFESSRIAWSSQPASRLAAVALAVGSLCAAAFAFWSLHGADCAYDGHSAFCEELRRER